MRPRKFVLIIIGITAIMLFANGVYMLELLAKGAGGIDGELRVRRLQYEDHPKLEKPVNILVLGLDEEESRSDVVLLLNYQPAKPALNILSVPRDTLVKVKGEKRKINSIAAYGGEAKLAEVLEKMTGLAVDFFLTMNFKGFREIVDTLGGVEFNVPMCMDYDDPDQNLHIHLQPGFQILNGEKAEQLVRYRKGNRPGEGYHDGDLDRMKIQQEFLKALIEQKLKLKYISKADEIFMLLRQHLKTDIELGDLSYFLRNARPIGPGDIKSFTAPGSSSYIDRTWYYLCDLKKTRALVEKEFFYE